ncbi:MAG: HAD-IIB family hydrolase [Isosphaeraceae bacterium]|nr:HAD-IIB family hydrolase [Isosphaeraceae bacterium]
MTRPSNSPNRFRILAMDVDGTLLDSQGTLRPRTAEAVALAARAGIRPVLCTGRRYRRARPIALQLGVDAPIVCNSGALVKDPATHATLWRADLDAELLAEALAVFRERDEPLISFTDRRPDDYDFIVAHEATGRPLFDDYLAQNQGLGEVRPDWAEDSGSGPHFHLCAIGTRPNMLDFEVAVVARLGLRVRTFVQKSPRYVGTMCEVLHRDASKWSAILHLAALWGVDPAEICAVGDDMNDVPMLTGAGLGVAMGHAPPAVLAAADLVTYDHDADGVARLVEDVLLA